MDAQSDLKGTVGHGHAPTDCHAVHVDASYHHNVDLHHHVLHGLHHVHNTSIHDHNCESDAGTH